MSDSEPVTGWSIVPSLLWVVFAFVVFFIMKSPLTALVDRVVKLKFGDVELQAIDKRLDRIISKNNLDKGDAPVSKTDPLRAPLFLRWKQMEMDQRHVRVLLLNDEMPTAQRLRDAFVDLGFIVDIGICGDEAESLLRRHSYDVVVSDIDWSSCKRKPNGERGGIDFLQRAYAEGIAQPTVFYVMRYEPSLGVPAYASGVTNNWYELLHLILDRIARRDASQSA